ncbi:MAG: RNA polymerase sigma-70 factor [Macellibacteroides fermentans]|uniref:RNA polymerase sigma-70 factor n=1 Tax=Macellibacteroides fermentans TaxID=879969 RepID=UPI003AC135C8
MITPLDINSEKNFETFYTSYYKRFVRYALYYVNDLHTAEDMTHDALLYYWEHKEQLTEEIDVLGYILLSVKNKCLNYLKHLQVEYEYNRKQTDLRDWEIDARIMTLEDETYGAIFSKDIMDIVTSSLSSLPEQTKEIFILNRFENKSRKEIAVILGGSQQKIDYHINKANDYLIRKLKDYIPLLLLLLKNN